MTTGLSRSATSREYAAHSVAPPPRAPLCVLVCARASGVRAACSYPAINALTIAALLRADAGCWPRVQPYRGAAVRAQTQAVFSFGCWWCGGGVVDRRPWPCVAARSQNRARESAVPATGRPGHEAPRRTPKLWRHSQHRLDRERGERSSHEKPRALVECRAGDQKRRSTDRPARRLQKRLQCGLDVDA